MTNHGRLYSLVNLVVAVCVSACSSDTGTDVQLSGPVNPYEAVDWESYSRYRADLHVHTIHSDGCHRPEEVIRVFHEAGFSILSITDHDTMTPNRCPLREAASPGQIELGVFAEEHSPFPDPHPQHFPANTTWPWPDFGSPSPADLGMVGIEGAELSCGHHLSAFFVDYGFADPCTDAPSLDGQLRDVEQRGGLALINHPEGRLKELYIELFRNHSASFLLGMEISRSVENATALWDQLLAGSMPSRPIWGFANSDMHVFPSTPFAFMVFVLDELTTEAVRNAMVAGRFYSVEGPGMMDLRLVGSSAYEETYPELRSFSIDRDRGEITIDAANYDAIVWISGASAWRFGIDPAAGITWPAGEIVGRGETFDYANTETPSPYVRAELIRQSETGPIRLMLNPVGLPDQ